MVRCRCGENQPQQAPIVSYAVPDSLSSCVLVEWSPLTLPSTAPGARGRSVWLIEAPSDVSRCWSVGVLECGGDLHAAPFLTRTLDVESQCRRSLPSVPIDGHRP